jgi:hypothetical protein
LWLRLILGALVFLAPTWARADDVPPKTPPPALQFKDYPATAHGGHRRNTGPLGPTSSGGLNFRTRLKRAAAEASNFAEHYVVALWGCGTECLDGAVINTWDRKVIWLPGSICCTFSDFGYDVDRASYRIDSALLILRGRLNEKAGTDEEHYYRIDGDHLVHLLDVPLPAGHRP